jgi:hypothetical protein
VRTVQHTTTQVIAAVALTALTSCAESPTRTSVDPPTAVQSLAVNAVPVTTVAGVSYASSTRLRVSWSRQPTLLSSVSQVQWTDVSTGTTEAAATRSTTLLLENLKSATEYRITVVNCRDDFCTSVGGATPVTVTATTPGEVWHMQGTGASMAGLRRIVSDGNVKLHVLRYGSDAPPALAGRVQMYYGPFQANAKGLAVGVSSASASAGSLDSYLSFTSRAGVAGLISPPTPAPLVSGVATGQAVPLSAAMGGRIRLYFEAADAAGRTRILSLDSQDGYTGLDFNSGAATVCATAADYSTGGGCFPSVVLGLDGDATLANPRIQNARQFKIGYPTQTDWRWNGAPGTFMVFTTDIIPGCSTSQRNHGYALWNGSTWVVQYESPSGCPKLFRSVQAAHPLHIGGVKYKLYYGDPSDVTGRLPGSTLPFLGPKKLIYADGAFTGDLTSVEFEEWEPTSAGRTLTLLWPNGTPMDATARGYIDDFSVVAPTGDLSLQVFYLAITDGTLAPFTTAAVLINP